MNTLQIEQRTKNQNFKINQKIADLKKNSYTSDIGIKVNDDELSCTTPAVPYYKPFIKYEIAVWIFYGAFTILAIVDRFVWNIWPRHMYTIGDGSAGTDFTDGLKPGPWSVKFFDICARVSGRFTIVALNLLLFTMMKTSMSWISESWIAQYVVDMSDSVEGNHRLHKWNGIMICILTLLHIWSILFPCIFQGFQAKVVLGTFEWPLSERNPAGFKDVNPKTETVMLQGDDVWRLVEMTLLLAILMPLSLRWLKTKWHLGIHIHNFISVAYFIDIVRRHTHPHSWILNTPFFVIWLGDVFVGIFWRRNKPEIYRKQLSDDYMLLFWKQATTLATVGPKYYIRMRPSSFLERAHVFTAFENRCGLDMADGREWSVGLLVRVYRNPRKPVLGKLDKVSHTQRVFDSKDLTMTTWGPFIGGMSDQVKWNIHHAKNVGIVAGGSAAGYILDALQQHRGSIDSKLIILYTTRDPQLLIWLTHWMSIILKEASPTNVKILLALTHGNKKNNVSNLDSEEIYQDVKKFNENGERIYYQIVKNESESVRNQNASISHDQNGHISRDQSARISHVQNAPFLRDQNAHYDCNGHNKCKNSPAKISNFIDTKNYKECDKFKNFEIHTNIKKISGESSTKNSILHTESKFKSAVEEVIKLINAQNVQNYIHIQSGRIDFVTEIPEKTKIFFQGSGGLQKAVEKACKIRGSRLVAGPAFDQDPEKSRSFGDYWRRMNCCNVQQDETQPYNNA